MHSKVKKSLILFHVAQSLVVYQSYSGDQSYSGETCTPLSNRETYSSVRVSVGHPAQRLDLVADTGSDNCIVKDCSCKLCPSEWGSACFSDPISSDSFNVPLFDARNYSKGEVPKDQKAEPAKMVITFGSGDVAINIASDDVQIGRVKAYLKNGLFLMVDHDLDIKTHFEGILGLGRPGSKKALRRPGEPLGVKAPGFFDQAHVQGFSMCFNRKSDGVLGINTKPRKYTMTAVGDLHWALDFQGISVGDETQTLSFCDPKSKTPEMQTACTIIPDSGTTLIAGGEEKIAQLFESICQQWQRCQDVHEKLKQELSKLEKDGVRVTPPSGLVDTSVQRHDADGERDANAVWVVGRAEAKRRRVILKTISDVMARHMPGPSIGSVRVEAVSALSKGESVADPAEETFDPEPEPLGSANLPQSLTIQLLMEHCAKWIGDVDLDQEMPKIQFHVAGANGHTKKLSLSPRSYVMSKNAEVEVDKVRNIFGFPLNVQETEHKEVCMLAFSPIDYQTPLNGEVWIFGTPLFYQYTVHYNRQDISMAFVHRDEEVCGKCKGDVILRQPRESLINQEVGDHGRLGQDSLHHISTQPLLRNVSGIQV